MGTKPSKTYLVVWRADHEEFMQSAVTMDADIDPTQLTNNEWVTRAAITENETINTEVDGYDLILVCDMPVNFYGS